MNYFKSIMLTAFAVLALAACDTDDLKDDINDLKGRVESLEAQVSLLNDNMTAIKRLLEGGQTITKVEPKGDAYTLTLSDGSTITLTQGSEGNIIPPTITVNSEGQWVVNGVVLTQNGVPVQAIGTPGKDGLTPKFQISNEGNYWQISYDGGTEWEYVLDENYEKVSAVSSGEGGGSSSDGLFEEVGVSKDGDFFVIKLKGQAEAYSIPIVKDVICEIAEPTEGLKNGYWEIGYGKTATTTIKVKGENIITTAPTGWVVTVSDIDTDKNEAILSVTAPASAPITTRATADNSNEVTVQANTNASWAVAKIKVKAIEIIDSYYALYEAGRTFTINGVEVNSSNFPNAEYISEDKNITTTGIYFIKEGITVSYKGTAGVQNLILIGDNSQKASTVNVDAQIKLVQATGTKGYFLCKNIALIGTSTLNNQLFTFNTDNSPYEQVAFDQCQIITSPGKHVLYLATATRSIANFSMENSTFKSEATGEKNIFSLGGSTSTDYKTLTFKNNIFYCAEGKVNQFSLFKGNKASITGKLTLENNTFINMQTATTGYVYINELADISIKNNIFWTDKEVANDYIILRPTTLPTGTTCTDNIGYKINKKWAMFYNNVIPDGMDQIIELESNPFDGGTFDLANGIFIPNAEYAQYGAGASIN